MAKPITKSSAITVQEEALRLALPTAITAGLLAWGFAIYWATSEHVVDNLIMFVVVAICSFFIPLVMIFRGFRRSIFKDAGKQHASRFFRHWILKDSILSLAYAFLFLLAGVAMMLIFALAFKDMAFTNIGFAATSALVAAFWVYYSVNFSSNYSPDRIINLIGAYLIGGIGIAAIFNPNPTWWKVSVSFLGYGASLENYILDLALIISGALLLIMSVFLFEYKFEPLHKQGLISNIGLVFTKAVFIISPIGLMCVGIFPKADNHLQMVIHNNAALLAFVPFAIYMGSLYWLMPFLSKYFLRINYVLLVALVITFQFRHQIQLSLALSEIGSFAILALWLLLFLKTIDDTNSSNKSLVQAINT